MSQAVNSPVDDPALTEWFKAMTIAFGEKTTEKPSQPEPASTGRLTTLAKTLVFAQGQPPDIAIRALQDITSELEVMRATGQFDAKNKLSEQGLNLLKIANGHLEGIPTRAMLQATQHATSWTSKVNALKPATAGLTGEAAKTRAKAVLAVINEVGTGIAEDEAMLERAGVKGATTFNALKTELTSLRNEYKSLEPKRTRGVEPSDPPASSPRPKLGGADAPKELGDLLGAIEGAMGRNDKPDLEKLETAVAVIAQGVASEDAAKEMKELKSWDAVKAKYRTLAATNKAVAEKWMQNMWWFRRMTVDGMMTKLQGEYDMTWGAVGSSNLESDYDVTVRTHGKAKGTGEFVPDYKIVEEFNAEVSALFGGTPPGILFDTNLYAEAKVEKKWDSTTPTGKNMDAMTEQGQDVGALMKLRRYMDWDDYEDYKQKTLAGLETTLPAELKGEARTKAKAKLQVLTLRQFEEADSLFLIARSEQLRAAGKDISGIPDTIEGQKQILEMAEELEHHPEEAMKANNALYMEKIAQVRTLEQEILALGDAPDKADQKSALLARLRTLQADATFFAAEAYHSEGPLKHVVQAGQSSKLEVANDKELSNATDLLKKERIKELTEAKLRSYSANQMLQSFNENLGDLLKDLKHYESEPFPGLGFYRSSKYLERMCDAAIWTASKLPPDLKTKCEALRLGGKTADEVKGAVGGLVAIRGEAKVFTGVADPEQEKQAYAIEQMSAIFPGVTTLRDLGRLATEYGRQLNGIVRAAVTASMTAESENAYFSTVPPVRGRT